MELDQVKKETEPLLRYLREYAEMKLADEEKREQSLLTQSSNMQTAFSFTIAAIFMVMPIIIDHRGAVPLSFLFAGCSVVVLCLMLSLLFSCLAQNRKKSKLLSNTKEVFNFVNKKPEEFLSSAQQDLALIKALTTVQSDKSDKNDWRAKIIIASMTFFYIALALICIWYLLSFIWLAQKK